MSKVDAQRAMREARYARISGSGPSRREAPTAEGTPTSPPATPAAGAPGAERCGHKSMNGRACTREAAHSEKSHRYS